MAALPNGPGVDSKRRKLSSLFSELEVCPPDAIFNVKTKFLADKSPDKVNLGIGAYRTEEGQPWVLPVVKTTEAQMNSDPTINHEYLPLDGMKAFTESATRLLLGESSLAVTQNRAVGVQALSGTGSLRLGAEFLKRFHSCHTILLPSPTWANHYGIFGDAGLDVKHYRYWQPSTRGLDLEGMLSDLQQAPEHAILLLHACAHNPTGLDPTNEEWLKILEVVKERSLFPFFDCAYQGFVSGDPEKDAWALREFVKAGIELFCAQSFSKNFGLYNERVGQLCVVLNSPDSVPAVRSHLTHISRRIWSNCPHHGARIVATVLNNPSLTQEWKDNLAVMSGRIAQMRSELYQQLRANGIKWDHLLTQRGMFSYTGLTVPQVEYLTSQYHIYLMRSGRINLCGLNSSNLQYIAEAIKDALAAHP